MRALRLIGVAILVAWTLAISGHAPPAVADELEIPIVDMSAIPAGTGYWLVDLHGDVTGFGRAQDFGDVEFPDCCTGDIVGIVGLGDGSGYWVAEKSGRIHAFGAAPHLGEVEFPDCCTGDIVAFSGMPNGRGYWAVDHWGRVHAFGAARKFGQFHSRDITDIHGLPNGQGYWILEKRGAVHAFGGAKYAGEHSFPPCPGLAISIWGLPSGLGYHVAGTSGHVASFGRAQFQGEVETPDCCPCFIVALEGFQNRGYWLAHRDGFVLNFGEAPHHGDLQGGGPGGQPKEAADGEYLNKRVCTVDKTQDYFTFDPEENDCVGPTETGLRSLEYDANDLFIVDGKGASMKTFEAELAPGVLVSAQTYHSDDAEESIFEIVTVD